jgi:hypothetical protein
MTSPRARRPKVPRRKVSIRRKLLVGGLAASAAALQIYLANIPRTIDLPQEEVDAQTFAKADNERIEIDQPSVPEGGLLLSYAGKAGDVTDLHFDDAIVDPSNASLQSTLKPVAPVPAKIAYVSIAAATAKPGEAPASPGGDTCHTSVEIRRARASSPITSISAFLLNGTTNNEQRRELRVWTDGGALDVLIHTDPPPAGNGKQIPFDSIPGCNKILQVRPLDQNDPNANVDVPLIQAPIHLLVPDVTGQKASNPANTFRIGFTPAFVAPLKWLSADDMFDGVSLGDTSLESKQLRVLPLRAENGERLKATAEGTSTLVLDRLAFSLNALRLRVSGPASVEIDGKRLGFDLMRFLKQNPILSGVLGLLNAAILLLVKEALFPRAEDQPDETD